MDITVLQQYAALGVRIHPLKVGGKTPALKGWVDSATVDMDVIKRWHEQMPDANWGAATGSESGITVVDIDPRNGGTESWAALIAKHGEPHGHKVSTPSGGTHYYFKYFMGSVVLGRGIDILAARHNVVLPPSVTADGRYEWIGGAPKSFITAPLWLRQSVKVKSGSRNEDAYRTACVRFRAGASQEAVMDEILAEYGDENDAEHNLGIRKTVLSAFHRVQAPRSTFANFNGNDPSDFDSYVASDFGNAQLLVKYVGSDVLYVRDVGWVVYKEGRWQFDDNLIYNRFTDIMDNQRVHYAEAANRATDKVVEKELRYREAHFTMSTNNRTVKNGIESAQSMPGFGSLVSNFDNGVTAHLLNFSNGTVDLNTGVLHPHNKEHFITKICPSAYDPKATAPFWEETLLKIFDGDEEMIRYVQLMLGASIMGSQDVRMLFIAYGKKGKNGKSTVFEALAEVLGDYADHAELKMLAGTDSGNLTELTTRMRIRGARFVFSSEMTSGDQMDANMIKRLTGGDTISARSMFKATTTFRPICSIWLRTNQLPTIRGADQAFWDRICIIPFDHQFVGTEVLDMGVVMEKLKAEAQGILAWLVRGAVNWNRRNGGFTVPQRVRDLRDMYMSDTDTFTDFTMDTLVQSADAEVKISTVHRAYSDYCKKRGVPAPSLSALKQDLRAANQLSSDGRFMRGFTMSQDYGVFEM
jgi:P4 family phage/plasmid primase-like protien